MVSPAFADLLASGRAEFNRRTAEAARRHPGFDHGALRAFLADGADALVQAVAAAAPERALAATFEAYDIALELTGLRLVGPAARSTLLPAAWRRLLPRLAALVAREPEAVIGLVSNAALHLETIPGVRGAQWIAEMSALAPRIDSSAQLRIVGQLLAWRAGAAHFRSGALAAADSLPEALAMAALGDVHAGSWASLRARIEADPWWRAGDGVGLAEREAGAFSGLGGMFGAPPAVRAAPGGFYVASDGRHFLLLADAYGAVLVGADSEEFAQAGAAPGAVAFTVEGERIAVGRQRIALDLPAEGLAVCASAGTLAITSPFTHAIRLVPRQ
jgi:hypothetical protein